VYIDVMYNSFRLEPLSLQSAADYTRSTIKLIEAIKFNKCTWKYSCTDVLLIYRSTIIADQ